MRRKTHSFSKAFYLVFLLLLTTLTFCTSPGQAETNYADPANWSILCENPRHHVDVFFVHPTTYGPPSGGRYTADLRDEALNEKTDVETVQWITKAFEENCNIFAPRYRQMNIEVLSMPDETISRYMEIAAEDVTNAFLYYLKHLNQGRPLVLASHSQGSYALKTVFLADPKLLPRERLVAAYMPGWTFTDKDLLKLGLKLGGSPEETGVLLAWNTLGPGGSSPTLKEGALCVNPLSWTPDTKEYPASLNQGARIFLSREKALEIPHFTSARINARGGLEIPTPREDILKQLNMSMGKECYHRYDYDFFYENIKENVALRCSTFLEAQHTKEKAGE